MQFLADPAFLAAAFFACLIAGVSKGGFGASAGFAGTPILALAAGPEAALAIMLPVLWMMDWVGLRAYWRQWDRAHGLALLTSAAVGVAVGALLFPIAPEAFILLLIGATAVAFVLLRVFVGPTATLAPGLGARTSARVFGSTAGFTSMIAHAGGPLVAMYLLPRGLDRRTFQATTVLFFWGVNTIKFAPFLALGVIDGTSATASLALAPVAVVGVLIGVWANGRVSDRFFNGVVSVLLFVVGLKLMWDGVRALAA